VAVSVTPIYPAYVPSYATRESYITVDEFLAAPTGTDTTQLLPGQNAAANRDALAGVIQRASSEADVFCQQVLAATQDVQMAPPQGWRIQLRSGLQTIWVPVDNTPVIAVTGATVGWDPTSVTALTDLTGVWIGRKVITVPVTGITGVPPGATPGVYPSWPGGGGRIWGYVNYINGFFNATLSADVAAGATSVTPSDVLGLYPGLQFVIYDSLFAHSETVTVASNYTPGDAAVPLVSALAWPHNSGTAVSALPPAVRQAVISLTASLIKRRGGESLVLASITEEPSRKTIGESGMSADERHAYDLLTPFKRVR
jgi:hypothetical protein